MKTLLITDDDPSVLNLAAFILQQSNYRCLKAASAAEALRQLSDIPRIDALISDIQMPEMSGIELGRSVRRMRRDLPILLISGFSGEYRDASQELLQQPKVGFLPKPFTPAQLKSAVDLLLAA